MIEFPEPTMIKTNGINMAVYETGPKSGIPIVLCHGFPELAYSWRHQLPALAAAGYHVIAPDQRGYGRSSRPANVADYDMVHLTGDLVGILDALGLKNAIFCGHDWGGIVVWQMPLLHPGRVKGVIGVNTPFMARPPIDPIQGMKAMFGEDMYIVYFQKPGEADAVLAKNVEHTFRFFMRKTAANAQLAQRDPNAVRSLALVKALKADTINPEWDSIMPPPELQVFIDTYTRTGFTGGINWYRNMTRNWELSGTLEQKVRVPGLMIMAENDIVLRPAMADGMERFVPDLEKKLIKNCGHWTQQEHPGETNALMIDWLKRRFG